MRQGDGDEHAQRHDLDDHQHGVERGALRVPTISMPATAKVISTAGRLIDAAGMRPGRQRLRHVDAQPVEEADR